MKPPRSRARPLVDLLHVFWRSPLLGLPFGAFFVLVSGQGRRAFPGLWLVATIFAFAANLAVWIVRHTLEPRILGRTGEGPRASLVLGGTYMGACVLGAVAAALVLNATLMPNFLGDARAALLILVYTLLFGALFLGLALARNFYQQAVLRAGSDRELQLARRIQRSFLLSEFPRRPRLEVHAVNVSSKEVSGDFYDVVVTPDDGLLLAVADVSGKGVPAALLSSMLQASLRTQAGGVTSPAAMMATINTLACQRDTMGQFATFFLAAVHEPTMTLRYTNAGHNYPVLLRSGGKRVLLETGGVVVGMMEAPRYEEGALTLATGDRVVFYTDGVTEAARADGAMFGEDRLYALLEALPRDLPAPELVQRVLDGVRAFLDGTEPGDDITVMALRVTPQGTGRTA